MKKLMLAFALFAFFSEAPSLHAVSRRQEVSAQESIFLEGYNKYLASHSKLYKKYGIPSYIAQAEYNIKDIITDSTLSCLAATGSALGFWAYLFKDSPEPLTVTTKLKDAQLILSSLLLACMSIQRLHSLSENYYHDVFTLSPQKLWLKEREPITWADLEKVEYSATSHHITLLLKSAKRIEWTTLPVNMAQDMFNFINHMIDGIKTQSQITAQ